MSTPDNMSNQPALLRANNIVNDNDGTWYHKSKITDPVSDKKKLEKSKSKQESSTLETNEIRDSLFHFNCRCSLCQDFDLAKLSNKKVSYAEVLSYSVKTESNRKDKDFQSIKYKTQKAENMSSTPLFDTKIVHPPPLSSSGNIAKAEFYRDDRVLKGGGKNDKMSQIFIDTIQVAKGHGINLKPDHPNAAVGNCLFESITDNVNHRPECFPEKLKEGVDHYRFLWVTELEEQYKATAHYPGYDGNPISDVVKSEWASAWTQQKNSGEYNVDKFNVSDLTPAGLGHCIKRDILVLSNDPIEPVKVFAANYFDENIQVESDIPAIIA